MLMGIPQFEIPVGDHGELILDGHKQWIATRRSVETSRSESLLRALTNPHQAEVAHLLYVMSRLSAQGRI